RARRPPAPGDSGPRARPDRALPLVRSVRPRDGGAHAGGRTPPRRAVRRESLPHRILLRQRGRLVERCAVLVLPREAAVEPHEAAAGGVPPRALSKRLA